MRAFTLKKCPTFAFFFSSVVRVHRHWRLMPISINGYMLRTIRKIDSCKNQTQIVHLNTFHLIDALRWNSFFFSRKIPISKLIDVVIVSNKLIIVKFNFHRLEHGGPVCGTGAIVLISFAHIRVVFGSLLDRQLSFFRTTHKSSHLTKIYFVDYDWIVAFVFPHSFNFRFISENSWRRNEQTAEEEKNVWLLLLF